VDSSEHLVLVNIQFALKCRRYTYVTAEIMRSEFGSTWNSPTKSPLTANSMEHIPGFHCVQDSNPHRANNQVRSSQGKFSTRLPKHSHVFAELIAHIAFDMSFHLSGTWLNPTSNSVGTSITTPSTRQNRCRFPRVCSYVRTPLERELHTLPVVSLVIYATFPYGIFV